MTTGSISDTPASVARLAETAKRALGAWFPARPWNTVATKDNIRHWCYGVADINPLYVEERYAGGSRWGTIVAPPLFTATFSDGLVYPYDPKYDLPDGTFVAIVAAPGIQEIMGSDAWEFNQVVTCDMRVHAEKALTALREVDGRFAGRSLVATWEVRYLDEKNEPVAHRKSEVFYVDREAAKARAKHGHLRKYRWEQDELQRADDSYLKESVRGGWPRWWQEVRVGDELGHVTKGPLTTTEIATFCVGWGGSLMLGDEISAAWFADHPEAVVPDPETNMPDVTMRIHWDDEYARAMGLPTAMDIGTQRVGWFDHLINNWKGDAAITKSLSVKLVEPNFIADATWIRGRVVRKHLDGPTPLVDLELTGTDQRGRVHSTGMATIELPTRGVPSARQVSSLS